MGLDHVAIPVADLAAARRFYVDGLGFAVGDAFASDDGTENVFVRGSSGARIQLRRGPDGAGEAPEAAVLGHLAVAVEDVTETVDRLVERTGCPVLREPGPGHAAPMIAFVEDPDGHRVELIGG